MECLDTQERGSKKYTFIGAYASICGAVKKFFICCCWWWCMMLRDELGTLNFSAWRNLA